MSEDPFYEIIRGIQRDHGGFEVPVTAWMSGDCSEQRPRYIEVECVLDLYDGSQIAWIVKLWGGVTVKQFAEGIGEELARSEFINLTDCDGVEQVIRTAFVMKFSAQETR